MRFDHVAQQVPDIEEAITWWQKLLPDSTVLHQDETWGIIEADGIKLAFVMADQHPDHLAWKVADEELEKLASQFGKEIITRRDNSRSFYIEAPGGVAVEIISYPGSS